jgi:FixJ family two-component response regulator
MKLEKLSPRQSQILNDVLLNDVPRKAVAAELGISVSTVNKHIERAKQRTGSRTIFQLQRLVLSLS